MTSRRNKRLETLESRAVDRKRQERAINLDLPEPGAAESLETASSAVLMAVAAGDITPGEGQSLTAILEGRRKVLELTDLERRLSELEEMK